MKIHFFCNKLITRNNFRDRKRVGKEVKTGSKDNQRQGNSVVFCHIDANAASSQ